jgi:ParB family transcriptional regulator, chromosome partitioning protein
VSSPRRLGLPQTIRMRHDTHFVDQLARPSGEAVGRMVPIEDLQPNPRQPRHDLGDLSELKASVREKGLLEPILVRPAGGRFEIIAGERRYRAAIEVGLSEVPCIVRDVGDAEMMELALIENLQRKDLSAFEEADGLKALAEHHSYTHEMMAERLGRSRSTITEMLSLTVMPEEVRELCRLADIQSKSVLLQIVRQSDPGKMVALVDKLQQEGKTRDDVRRLTQREKSGRGRPRNFVFRYQPQEKTFTLNLQFRKSQVPRDEIIHALEAILENLRADRG